jgi:hypothetical protein
VFRFRAIFSALIIASVAVSACSKAKATIIPKVNVNKRSAEMGTPLEITYSFSTKQDYSALHKDMTVFVHFIDPRKIRRFQDDHEPPKATSQWRANGNYNYTRTVFVPRNIPAGEYTIVAGIYTPSSGERVPLEAKKFGNRSYEVGKVLIEIPPQEAVIQYTQGWYDPESEPNDVGNYWRWTKKEAVLKVKNPNSDALLYLKLDGVPERFQDHQKVTLFVGDHPVDTISIDSNQPVLKKYNLSKDMLGTNKMVDVKLVVDKTFVPSSETGSKDMRELGIRVYQLYLGKASD